MPNKIFDVIYFFNELELLEIRLNVLNEVVDYFIILEANTSFTGVKKPLHFLNNIDRFSKWKDKIIQYTTDDFPLDKELYNRALSSPNVGSGADCWVREFYYKEHVEKALMPHCKDTDIVFVSDVDEIWNPELDIKNIRKGEVYRPIQTCYYFYLNNKSNLDITSGTGTRYATFDTLKKYGGNHFRTERVVQGTLVKNGGWHFTWLKHGINKLKENIHPEQDTRNTYMRIINEKTVIDNNGLPEYILKNKDLYKSKEMML